MPELWWKALRQTPVWRPGRNVSLGDVGIFDDGESVRKTTLKDEDIPFKTHVDKTPSSRLSIGSGNSWKLGGTGSGEVNVPLANGLGGSASLELTLSGTGSFSMDAYNILTHEITNLDEVEGEILRRDARRDDSWKYRWCVITQVLEAERSFVAVANGREASAELDLGVDPKGAFLDLASAEVGAHVSRSSHMAVANLALHPTVLTFEYRRLRDVFPNGTAFT